jgi:hypothetical protein
LNVLYLMRKDQNNLHDVDKEVIVMP